MTWGQPIVTINILYFGHTRKLRDKATFKISRLSNLFQTYGDSQNA